MNDKSSRREFIRFVSSGAAAIGAAVAANTRELQAAAKRDFKISLAAWSLHRTIGTGEGKTPMLDLPKLARQELGIEAIELVSGMMAGHDQAYLDELAKNSAEQKVKTLLIMVDGEGSIGGASEREREDAVKRHSQWIDAAQYLGCHSIRMNWTGAPKDVVKKPEELEAFIARSVDPLRKLCEYGDSKNVNVIIENHGGPSSYPKPMQQLMQAVNHPRFGTLPDFGNFPDEVDKYQAVDVLMNYAKAVSAKCYEFDPDTGEETRLDYGRLIEIVADKHGYHGYIGIEYEGNKHSEFDGVKACKKLLEKLRE
ncbi:MAG: TIM barrel protein [Candidatus Hydrogenedentes bacterium]|nr:TIM barrel protein [Candidatus Hydrogenedentota bacterium]